ncbi:MAG: FadR/GntR family transcriptional regulator [Sandaracinaceae bacterium]
MPRAKDGALVDEVTDRLAFEIASGVYAPGDRLPPVRELAARHGLNPSTVQVVVARLRTAGFIESSGSRRGGLVVRDVEELGGVDTWRYVFRFAQRLPERAIKLFEGFLSTRRILVIEVVKKLSAHPDAYDLAPLRREVERLRHLAESHPDPERFARAELKAARLMLRLVDEPVLLSLYNTIGEVLLEVPAVLQAMYREPTFNVAMWTSLVEAWEHGEAVPGAIETADRALAAFHETCVGRFRALVSA